MNRIQFDPRAEEEFLLGAKHYEGQEPGLGHRFVLAVQAASKDCFGKSTNLSRNLWKLSKMPYHPIPLRIDF